MAINYFFKNHKLNDCILQKVLSNFHRYFRCLNQFLKRWCLERYPSNQQEYIVARLHQELERLKRKGNTNDIDTLQITLG